MDDLRGYPPICEVCLSSLLGPPDLEDGCTLTADCCGREGLCAHCRHFGRHDCDEPSRGYGPPNYRFWVWWNGQFTKLTLRPGQEVNLFQGVPHEEGWSKTYERFKHVGDGVYNEYLEVSSDCDGRHEWHGEYYARGEAISERTKCNEGPAWERTNSEQRDQYAEIAGY